MIPPRTANSEPRTQPQFARKIRIDGVGYLLYFALIINVGPMKNLSVTYLMPAFGVVWGMIVLHERPHAGMLVGLAVILASVTLVIGMRPRLARRQPIPAPVSVAE